MNIVENEKFLTTKEVASRIGMSVRSVYRLVQTSQFPKPVKVANRSVRYPESEISAFITDLKRQRETV